MKIYNFRDSLKQSNTDEAEFISRFQPSWIKSESKEYDYTTPCGKTVEIKVDKLATSTGNFFCELFSTTPEGNRIGGPFRAFSDKVDYFVIWIFGTDEVLYFKTSDLHHFAYNMEKYYVDFKDYKTVKNDRFETSGFVVSIDQLRKIKQATI